MNILLATDGSEHSARAARYLATHVGEFAQKPTIHVLTVHAPIPFPGAAAAAGKKAVESYQREDSEKALAAAEKELKAAGVAYRPSWKVGEVAKEIQHFVEKNAIDLVVIGSHGHGALYSMALGSSAQKIIAAVKVPVLVVR